MGNAILATEIFGSIVLLIILYGALFEMKEKSKKKTMFIILVSSVLAAQIVDGISYLGIDWRNKERGFFWITMVDFLLPFLMYAIFLQYIYVNMAEKGKGKILFWPFAFGIGLCLFDIAAGFYYGMKGMLFTLENGSYALGEYYEGYLLTYILVLGYTILVILVNVKIMGMHDTIAAVMFLAIPIVFLVLNLLYSEMAFSVASLSISMLVVNTMLQADRESLLISNEAEIKRVAHFDELTGLYNRLAFTELIDRIDKEKKLGVIFGDVNGLKYANDHFGHKAGDMLLCEFSEMLLGCFRKEDVYRISGDEFVVLLPNVPQKVFEQKVGTLRHKIAAKEVPIAAIGYTFGSGAEVSRLIDMAEAEMYEDKKIFHEKYPKYKR